LAKKVANFVSFSQELFISGRNKCFTSLVESILFSLRGLDKCPKVAKIRMQCFVQARPIYFKMAEHQENSSNQVNQGVFFKLIRKIF
jgi:hypothetical protein